MTASRVAPPIARPPVRAATAGAAGISPTTALTVIGLGALAVIGLWWQDTFFIYGLGSWLTNAGRITGLLAGYAVVVLLALMARVPALERGVGADRLARWHASGGRYTVFLSLAHTLLIIWGYAVTAHSGLTHETTTLLTTYPDVLMATVALGLLLMIGVVSARAARKRMAYETWHLVHLYTYLAIALAFSHQFATGADFRDARVRWLWAAMYVVVGAALLWYRVVTPVVRMLRHQYRVVRVVPEGPGAVSVYITGRHLDRLQAEAGQFFRWRFLVRGLWWAANPYSLSAAPTNGYMRITVKVAGDHSAELARLTPGTRVLAEGPYGAFTAARRTRRKVLLIGVGIGITPLRALFESVPARPGDLTLLYRARKAEDLLLRNEIDQIAAARGAKVHYLLGKRHPTHDPLSFGRLSRLVPDIAHHDVFFCGPDDMNDDLHRSLRRAGVPARNIHHESFTF